MYPSIMANTWSPDLADGPSRVVASMVVHPSGDRPHQQGRQAQALLHDVRVIEDRRWCDRGVVLAGRADAYHPAVVP